MAVGRPNRRFRDATGGIPETVTADAGGDAIFPCNGRGVAVWVEEAA